MLWPDLDLDMNPLISSGYSDNKNGLNLARMIKSGKGGNFLQTLSTGGVRDHLD